MEEPVWGHLKSSQKDLLEILQMPQSVHGKWLQNSWPNGSSRRTGLMDLEEERQEVPSQETSEGTDALKSEESICQAFREHGQSSKHLISLPFPMDLTLVLSEIAVKALR